MGSYSQEILDTGSILGLILTDSFAVGQLPSFLRSSVSLSEEWEGLIDLILYPDIISTQVDIILIHLGSY